MRISSAQNLHREGQLVCDVDKLLTLTGGLMMSSAHTLQRGGQPGPLGCMLSTVWHEAVTLSTHPISVHSSGCKIIIIIVIQSYFNRKVNSLKAGTANWWRSIKTMESGTKAKLPAHYLIDDALCDPQRFVNKLNDYYSSVATPKQEPAVLDKQSIYRPDEISVGQVKKYLRQMDSRKSVHSGDFPPWITKMCCEDVCIPITNIVNHTLREQIFPAIYKSAKIMPVPKHTSASTLLGPTLWLAFVNSLQFSEGSTIKYADDTTSYFPLSKSANNITYTTPTEMTFDPPETGQQQQQNAHYGLIIMICSSMQQRRR
mgnify:CR=1 FL=1